MRVDLTRKILEHLEAAAMSSIYLSASIIVSGYGASPRKIMKKANEIEIFWSDLKLNPVYRKKKRSLDSLMYRLKKDGLIRNEGGKLTITKAGLDRLRTQRDRLEVKNYSQEKDATLKIIMFDIPEKSRSKRNWLRSQLISMGFSAIQRSVFIGKFKLPEEFIRDINKCGILDHLEIFSVTKTGSLKSVI